MTYTANVNAAVMHVADLDRSLEFYSEVLCCSSTFRNQDSAIVLTPAGFEISLIVVGHRANGLARGNGLQFFEWSTDSAGGLDEFEQVLRDRDAYLDSRVVDGVRFVEGHDPDGVRVIMAHPSPSEHPRTRVDSRFYA